MTISHGSMLPVGDRAPSFTAPDTHGATVSSEALRGQPVLLVFIPFAFTQVCGSEVAALRNADEQLTAAGAHLVVATCDSMMVLRAWAQAEQLPFTLVSDFWPHGAIARAYGAFNEADGAADRVSVLIDAEGTIAWSTSTARGRPRNVEDHLTAVRALRVTA